jgi:hypothetical protein
MFKVLAYLVVVLSGLCFASGFILADGISGCAGCKVGGISISAWGEALKMYGAIAFGFSLIVLAPLLLFIHRLVGNDTGGSRRF